LEAQPEQEAMDVSRYFFDILYLFQE